MTAWLLRPSRFAGTHPICTAAVLCLLATACSDDAQPQEGGSTGPAATTTGMLPPSSDTLSVPGDSSSTGEASADTSGGGELPLPENFAVTADWQARTLSVIDLDELSPAADSREDVVARTIDLADYAPGPLQVEIAPDGVTAAVSISPGFFGGFVGGVIGATDVEQDGALLIVDLDTRQVGEIATTHVPMGLAITPDGSRLFTANYGLDDPQGTTMTVVDLATLSVLEEVEVGSRPEQVTINAEGTLGALNVVGLGAVRVFEVADPSGTLSEPLVVGSDPSDVDFVDGTDYAVVANSLDPSNFVVIDVSNPAMPTEVEVGPSPLGSFYGASRIPATQDVVLTASDFTSVYLFRIRVNDFGTPSEVWQSEAMVSSFPLGVAIQTAPEQALVGSPGDGSLIVAQLDDGELRRIPWQDEIGPTYVALAP